MVRPLNIHTVAARRDDHLRAVLELVWNSLDAEAGTVDVHPTDAAAQLKSSFPARLMS